MAETQLERIVRLESGLAELEARFMEHRTRAEKDAEVIKMNLSLLGGKIDRQTTFVGGIIFTMSALWAFVVFAKDWILAHVK